MPCAATREGLATIVTWQKRQHDSAVPAMWGILGRHRSAAIARLKHFSFLLLSSCIFKRSLNRAAARLAAGPAAGAPQARRTGGAPALEQSAAAAVSAAAPAAADQGGGCRGLAWRSGGAARCRCPRVAHCSRRMLDEQAEGDSYCATQQLITHQRTAAAGGKGPDSRP